MYCIIKFASSAFAIVLDTHFIYTGGETMSSIKGLNQLEKKLNHMIDVAEEYEQPKSVNFGDYFLIHLCLITQNLNPLTNF